MNVNVIDNCKMELVDATKSITTNTNTTVAIYVAQHCGTCKYAYEVAETIQTTYPQVEVRLIDMETTVEKIPEAVFATPTYLLNGRLWSLGNPSPEQIHETLSNHQ